MSVLHPLSRQSFRAFSLRSFSTATAAASTASSSSSSSSSTHFPAHYSVTYEPSERDRLLRLNGLKWKSESDRAEYIRSFLAWVEADPQRAAERQRTVRLFRARTQSVASSLHALSASSVPQQLNAYEDQLQNEYVEKANEMTRLKLQQDKNQNVLVAFKKQLKTHQEWMQQRAEQNYSSEKDANNTTAAAPVSTSKESTYLPPAISPHEVFPLPPTWNLEVNGSVSRWKKELPVMDVRRYNEYQYLLYLKHKLHIFLNRFFPTLPITFKLNMPMLYYPEAAFTQKYFNADPNLKQALGNKLEGLHLLQVLFLMRKYRNAAILAEYLAYQLSLTRAHLQVLRHVENTIKWMEVLPGFDTGLKIRVSGKINQALRSQVVVIQQGDIPLGRFHSNIDYALAHSHNRTGVFGVKVWLFQRKLEKKEMSGRRLLYRNTHKHPR